MSQIVRNEMSGATLEHALTKGDLERVQQVGQIASNSVSVGAMHLNTRPGKRKGSAANRLVGELRLGNVAELKAMGACRGLDTEMFFPEESDELGIEIAREVCRRCVVRVECLDYALAANEKHGIWGGATEAERRRIRRQRRKAAEQIT